MFSKTVKAVATLAVSLGVLVFAGLGQDQVSAQGYAVPDVSQVTLTIPQGPSTTGENFICLARADTSDNWSTVRMVCYGSEMSVPLPPPPPPPYEVPVNHQVLIAYLSQSTGQLTASIFPCAEVTPGEAAVSVDMNIQLVKGGGTSAGSLTTTIDTISPFICDDGAQIVGPVTLTPLPTDNDWDGDNRTDWDELDSATLGDPFNPNDYGSVGGIAELPEVAKIHRVTTASVGTSLGVLAGIAVAAIVGVVLLSVTLWYGRRWLR